ncbi:hypothetical protein BSQ98_13625 [Serratia liquefaciens]|nr:hypothetical protein BSQ98_13625 [Serratia liquefaciens]
MNLYKVVLNGDFIYTKKHLLSCGIKTVQMKGDITMLVSIILFYISSYYCIFLMLSPLGFGEYCRHVIDTILS